MKGLEPSTFCMASSRRDSHMGRFWPANRPDLAAAREFAIPANTRKFVGGSRNESGTRSGCGPVSEQRAGSCCGFKLLPGFEVSAVAGRESP
jgi:hypothetical protein